MTTQLERSLDALKAEEFPAIEFDYQLLDDGNRLHIYHFEVLQETRGLGIGQTVLTDIEALAVQAGIHTVSVRMGLTEDMPDREPDPTVRFLEACGFETQAPTNGGVDAQKQL